MSILIITSCKKDITNQTNPETPNIEALNPGEVTASIKINHARLVSGTFPSSSTNGPQIDFTTNNQSGLTSTGGYILIQPSLTTGEVAGYYLRISGENTKYFKIDFSQPEWSERLAEHRRRQNWSLKQMDGNDPDYADSLIAIKLDNTFKPGTFCIEYQAYDFNNTAGNLIKYCVTVLNPGNDKRFTGTWQLNRYKSPLTPMEGGTNNEWRPASKIYGEMKAYACINNQLAPVLNNNSPDDLFIPESVVKYSIIELRFLEDGRYEYHERKAKSSYEASVLDLKQSTCSNYVYTDSGEIEFWTKGAWTYNQTSKQLLLTDLESKALGTDNYDHDWQPDIFNYDCIVVENISDELLVWSIKEGGWFSSAFEEGDWIEFKKVR